MTEQCSSCGGDCWNSCKRENSNSHLQNVELSWIIGWLREKSLADEDGDKFQLAATLLHDFKINAKALIIYCDTTGCGDSIYSLQCLRRLVEKMDAIAENPKK